MEEQEMQNKLRFKIGDIEFEAEGEAEVIARERNEFISTLLPLAIDTMTRTINKKQIPQITTLPQSAIIDGIDLSQETEDWSRTSLDSFIKQKGAKSNTDFILCAAFFKLKKGEIQSFSSTSAKQFYLEAKKPTPKNISLPIFQLVQKRHIMETQGKEYILTGEGEEYVNKLRPSQTKTRKTTSKPRKQRKKQTNQ